MMVASRIFFVGFFISSISLSSISHATVPDYFFTKDQDLKKNYNLYIIAYDPRLGGVYEVQTTQDARQKNHYTRLGDLSLAISKVDRSKYKRRPKKLIGKSFKIDKAPLKTYKAPQHIN